MAPEAGGGVLPAPEQLIARWKALSPYPGLILPDYDGYCITQVVPLIRHALGLPASLPDGLCALVPDRFRCVVLLILDAFGYRQLEAMLDHGDDLRRLVERSRLLPVTVPFPTTTTVALTTLYTGATPAEHGIPGHNAYLRELGDIVDLLRFSPAGEVRRDVYQERGVDNRALFPIETVFETLDRDGVAGISITRREFVNSALGRLHHHGAETYGYFDAADCFVLTRQVLEATDGPCLIVTYWDSVDVLSHVYGPRSDAVRAAGAQVGTMLRREVLDAISPAVRRETLLLLTADHGQVLAPPEEALLLSEMEELADALLLPPTGQPRAPFLYPVAGRGDDVITALGRYPDRFVPMRSDEALDQGLFGPPQRAHERLRLRVGEYLALGRGGAQLLGRDVVRSELRTRGRHGSLTEEEVLVPLLALPLDAW